MGIVKGGGVTMCYLLKVQLCLEESLISKTFYFAGLFTNVVDLENVNVSDKVGTVTVKKPTEAPK